MLLGALYAALALGTAAAHPVLAAIAIGALAVLGALALVLGGVFCAAPAICSAAAVAGTCISRTAVAGTCISRAAVAGCPAGAPLAALASAVAAALLMHDHLDSGVAVRGRCWHVAHREALRHRHCAALVCTLTPASTPAAGPALCARSKVRLHGGTLACGTCPRAVCS